ncbi:serine-rich adhesin for platelets-like isoform X1 [Asterias rubens]|uniref:serine-rich adhesin for platelets-like isoform X1 n=1 Tax=Asterias rubens TaxID=7604 RepID=UPI0014558010|nr:serine-rich adhesin for platelets-like isoform X1 [Asterias rubens]
MLTGGAYSQKFKDLEQERLDKLSGSGTISEGLSHAQQLAARDKVRQLSLETNRRRRAQELKRRLEAQKEAKRRQEVLEERRKRQQEATQRYQRLQKGSSPKTERASSGKSYKDSRLQDGVNVARGNSRPVSLNNGNHSNLAPALEEALRMVGVNTAPARGGGYAGETDYTTNYRGGYSDAYNPVDYVGDIPFRRQVDGNGNTVVENKGQIYHGYATRATATSNSNSNRDAVGTSPYQQTLHEQQRQLMEQQQAALHEFNQAVLNEALPTQGEEMERSSSVLSLDSLEDEQQNAQKTLGYDGRKKPSAGGSSALVHGGGKARTNDEFSTKTGVNSSSVQTRSAYGNSDTKPREFNYTGRSAISDNRLFTSNTGPNGPQSGGFNNGELLIEETSESDFIRDPVDSKPSLLQRSMQHPPYSARASQAWVSQAPSDAPQFHDASHSQGMYATGPGGATSGQRPFSAQTTATAVTNYPARVPESPMNYNHHTAPQRSEYISGKPNIPATTPNRAFSTVLANARYNSANGDTGSKHNDPDLNQIKAKYSDASYLREHSSHNESQPTEKKPQANSTKGHGKTDTSANAEKTVRSILKRGQGSGLTSQKVKLGVMKVKDSIEISRATQVAKSDRKSVRWTDVKYADEVEERSEDRGTATEKSEASRVEKPKPTSSRPADDSTKAHSNGKRHTASAVSVTPPRKPTLLPRMMPHNPSKPPLGRTNPGSPGKQSEPANPPRGTVRGTQETNKYTPAYPEDGRVYQNGIRLDKTPTDDEINWLWDKVRTCLNTQDDQASDTSSSRQPATVSKQSIDGNRLTANLRVSTQSASQSPAEQPLTHQQKYNTYPRLRTNSASSAASLRKTALLQQRRQHSAAVGNLRPGYQGRNHQQYTGPVPGFQPSPPSSSNHHAGPTASNQGPMRAGAGHTQGHGQEVSDSLLAFQQAERLAQENLSESEMAAALDEQKNHAYIQKVPVTALSMEEQRILESLDKLNAQLRTVSSETNAGMQPYMMIQPKPPPQGSGYRGHRPLSCRQRAVSDGNVSLRTRTLSADRSNARINYRH